MEPTKTVLEKIVIKPDSAPIASVIWLHGLGADGNDFAPIVPALNLPKNLPIRFVFPHAPMQAVTINNGYIMRAWYDIVSFEVDKHADEKGIQQSIANVSELIEREEQLGIPSDKIILAGFSQGSVIALTTGLTYPKPLAGIIALSGYLPFADQVMAKATVNKQIPIFLGHGTEDPVVPFFLGQATHQVLTQHHYPVAWHSYAIPHSVCLEEIGDIVEWIKTILAK